MLDAFDAVLRQLVEIKAPRALELRGYAVDSVRRRLAELRTCAVRAPQKTRYQPGRVTQVDWAEMPTRHTTNYEPRAFGNP
jgi:hypothetical protein